MTKHKHDIAIVGAGPAGSAAAYFLAREIGRASCRERVYVLV